MKKLIAFIIFTFGLLLVNSCFKANDNVGHDGKCTGSAYCSACTNCSRCGHCGSGGTCGVCGGGSSESTLSYRSSSKKSRHKKRKTSKIYVSSKTESRPPKVVIDEVNVNINANNRYLTGVAATKIYEKPAFKSNVVAIITKNVRMIQLSKKGKWYKVKVKSSGKTGYAYYKNIKEDHLN